MTIKEKIEALAHSTFEEIQRTEARYKAAEEARRSTPIRYGVVDAEYQAKATRAEADFQEAKNARTMMQRNLPYKAREALAAIRQEYVAEVQARFAVDPAKLDQASLELLKSGIMKPSEYRAMFDRAVKTGNTTMTRIISKYAAEAANHYDAADPRASELRIIGYEGNSDPASEALSTFNGVAEIFSRTIDNPGIIKDWDSLAGRMLDLL